MKNANIIFKDCSDGFAVLLRIRKLFYCENAGYVNFREI